MPPCFPRWRGAAPIQRAILAGDATSGVTIMLMDVGLDTGPMLLRKEVPIEAHETGGSLHDRLSALGGAALIEALEGHAAGTLRAIPQPAEGVTYAAKLEKAEALIDWTRDAIEIERQVRAFNPWPVAETRLDGEQLRVFEARAERAAEASTRNATLGSLAVASTIARISTIARSRHDHRRSRRRPRRPMRPRASSPSANCSARVAASFPAADFARSLHLTGRRLG